MHEGSVYTHTRRPTYGGLEHDSIFLVSFPGPFLNAKSFREDRKAEYAEFKITAVMDKASDFCWRIFEGHFRATSNLPGLETNGITRMPLEELAFFDTKNLEGEEKFLEKHRKSPILWFDVVAKLGTVEYFETDRSKKDAWQTVRRIVKGVYFDFLPTTPTTMVLFVLRKERIHVWACVVTKSEDRYREFDVKCVEVKDELIGVDFEEPFQVFGKEQTYYFVTQSGRLYYSRKPPANGKRKAEVLWKDEKSPIRAVICDTASERTFVFTEPAKKGGERVYLELAEKIETKPYERVPVERVKEPLKTVMEYAQVLVKDKRIK
jgi:hypothetical protein